MNRRALQIAALAASLPLAVPAPAQPVPEGSPTAPGPAPTPAAPGRSAGDRAPASGGTRGSDGDWLLDAMRPEEDGTRSPASFEELIAQVRDGRSPAAPAAAASRKSEHAPAPNPLTAFMADWMTPSDYHLLQSPSEDPTGSMPQAPETAAGAKAVSATQRPTPGAEATNPFLEVRPVPASNRHESPALPSLPATVPVPTDEAAAPKSRVPWRPPPKVDDKYFPQLKRF